MIEHSVRLVVEDDLRRSRLTVFFRFLLAIPHFLWIGLWTIVVFVILVIAWFSAVILGRIPQGFHDFLAAFVRYATHVEAYLSLAANPYPGFFLGTARAYPIDLEIDPPGRLSRWKALLRLFLALPALFIAGAFVGGAGPGGRSGGSWVPAFGLVGTASFLTWFAALARGHAPRGLRDVIAWGLGYSAQTTAYLFLLTDRYPYSGPEAHLRDLEPAPEAEGRPRLVVMDDLRRSRLTVFFRLPLSFPHVVWFIGWTVLAWLAAFSNWLAALVLGRAPRPLARFLTAYVHYATHFWAFFTLVGNPFPGFVGRAGSYPIDVEFGPSARQSRWVTLFRLVLWLPAWMMMLGAWGLLWTASFLAWFAALARGRMPEGFRNAGAWALGYTAQAFGYLYVLTDRYPYSGPTVSPEPAPSAAPTLD